MAFAPVAQAVATAVLGPWMRKRIETLPLAALTIRRGTVNGLTRDRPRVLRILFCSSSVSIPPMPLPTITPARYESSLLKSMPESATAEMEAARPNWPKRSSRRPSFTSTPYLVTSKLEHSPPKRVVYLELSQRVIGPMPLLPAQRFSHSSSTTSPSEVTTPRPVMTTRRLLMKGGPLSVVRCQLLFTMDN